MHGYLIFSASMIIGDIVLHTQWKMHSSGFTELIENKMHKLMYSTSDIVFT